MTKDEQVLFVDALTKDLAKQLIKKIDEGKIPENWDGIELRWYMQEQISWERKDQNKRKRAYKNTCMVNGL